MGMVGSVSFAVKMNGRRTAFMQTSCRKIRSLARNHLCHRIFFYASFFAKCFFLHFVLFFRLLHLFIFVAFFLYSFAPIHLNHIFHRLCHFTLIFYTLLIHWFSFFYPMNIYILFFFHNSSDSSISTRVDMLTPAVEVYKPPLWHKDDTVESNLGIVVPSTSSEL